MIQQGEFSTHVRRGDYVTKRAHAHHPAGANFMTALMSTGAQGMRSYLGLLHTAEVTLPPELLLVADHPLTIRHRWVSGPTLLNTTHIDSELFTAAIVQIGRWVQQLDSVDARIDTNLANFCLDEDQLVLVDVLPPLIPSLRPEPDNLFDQLFSALCFDSSVTLDALIGYAIRASFRHSDPFLAGQLLEVGHKLGSCGRDTEEFPASWFCARRKLAFRTVAGEVDRRCLEDFFALTSVLRFRQLTEYARRLRIDQVARYIEEMGLC